MQSQCWENATASIRHSQVNLYNLPLLRGLQLPLPPPLPALLLLLCIVCIQRCCCIWPGP
jgi:hypothetical protein